jgi:hypothetical protein
MLVAPFLYRQRHRRLQLLAMRLNLHLQLRDNPAHPLVYRKEHLDLGSLLLNQMVRPLRAILHLNLQNVQV